MLHTDTVMVRGGTSDARSEDRVGQKNHLRGVVLGPGRFSANASGEAKMPWRNGTKAAEI
jgi:hypothetical protein